MACGTVRSCAPRFTRYTKLPRLSTWWTRFSSRTRCRRGEESPTDHRRRLQRESRAGRMGGGPALSGQEERTVGLRAADDEQSNGTDGGDRRPEAAEGAVRSRGGDGFGVRDERDHELDPRLEEEGLDDGGQEA